MEYYILLNEHPQKVEKSTLREWLKGKEPWEICVAETHLIHAGNGNDVAAITTRYAGCDDGLADQPMLWETRMTYLPDNVWHYSSKEIAKKRHEQYVNMMVCYFKAHVFDVIRRDIDI